jgi:hypothetical protein
MRVGLAGCQRVVSFFSRNRNRHHRGSMSSSRRNQRSAEAAGGFGLQADEQGIQWGVVAAGGDGFVDCGESGCGQGVADGGVASRFADAGGGVVGSTARRSTGSRTAVTARASTECSSSRWIWVWNLSNCSGGIRTDSRDACDECAYSGASRHRAASFDVSAER